MMEELIAEDVRMMLEISILTETEPRFQATGQYNALEKINGHTYYSFKVRLFFTLLIKIEGSLL
jgi:hypothetical protein